MAKKTEISFQEAMDELKNILMKIESDDIEIDDIPKMITRAKELQSVCHSKLSNIQIIIENQKGINLD